MHEQYIQMLDSGFNALNRLFAEHVQKKDGEPNPLKTLETTVFLTFNVL